jgi:predicted Rossmann fold flavoprotein
MTADVAIIGAGAAGCFCAIELRRRHPELEVRVYEAGNRPLAKVALTGGGRCNLTNSFRDVRRLSEVYPRGERLMKRALSEFSQKDTVKWFENEGVRLVVQDDQCVFPASQDAIQIVRTLERAMREEGVILECNKRVSTIRPEGSGAEGGFRISFADGGEVLAAKVVFTIGGCSDAALGRILPEGIELAKTVPSLFTLKIEDPGLRSLMGTVVQSAALSLAGTGFRSEGTLLITDWGVSGPATLRLSSYAARYLAENEYRASLLINWLGSSESEIRSRLEEISAASLRKQLSTTHPAELPDRLWRFILGRCGFREDLRWAELGSRGLNRLVGRLLADEYEVVGRAKFKEEFVTCGGVALGGIDLPTQQSRLYPGLYFAGEVLDVDAVTGGFNLQAAWSTGWRVANKI